MSKNVDALIKKITEKGFSKSKAQKALKDCNNNVQQALKLLENQVQQAEKAAKAEELLRQKEMERAAKEELKAQRRARGLPEDSEEEREIEASKNVRIKLHPCIAQYGSCKYGKYCHFKYLPADTCVNYLLGNCIYDIKCRNRHCYEGEDLRKYVKEAQQEAIMLDDHRGGQYALDPNARGKVLEPEYYQEAYDDDEGWVAPAPLPSAFDTTDGAEPTYTAPINIADALWDEEVPSEKTPAPQPFLEKLRAGLDAKLAEKKVASPVVKPSKVVVVGGGPSSTSTATNPVSAQQRFAAVSKAKHPCIYQMGNCMFGDKCSHKNLPADICVFYLNGKCRLPPDECPYRHEKPSTAGNSASSNTVMSEEELMMIHGRPAGTSGDRMSALLAPHIPSSPNKGWTIPSAASAPRPFELEIQNETEEMSFFLLKDAFPNCDDLDLLQALRLGGSRDAAADLLLEFDAVDSRKQSAIEARLQEQEALEQIDNAESTERLVTLCQLFPRMEVESIEAALEHAAGDFDVAFRDLQCRSEHIVKQDPKNKWAKGAKEGFPTAADKLKLDRLYAMFPELPTEVVNDAYLGAGTMPLAVETLRLLALDLSKITDEDRAEADKMRTYHCVPQTKKATTSSFSVSSGPSVPEEDTKRAFISDSDLYKQVVEYADGKEDWRRLRQDAAMINRARIQCMSLAANAYQHHDGAVAKNMGQRARQLGLLYARTNILAMHALEAEGKGAGTNILDLHGFRKEEALDVLKRRLELCVRKRCKKLRVILGRGQHSQQMKAVLFPLVLEAFRTTEPFKSLAVISSVKQAFIDVDVNV